MTCYPIPSRKTFESEVRRPGDNFCRLILYWSFMVARGLCRMTWSTRTSAVCRTRWRRDGACSNAAGRRSMLSRRPSSSWKTMRLSMPDAAAFSTATGACNWTRSLWMGQTLRAGGVGCVEHLRNPVRAARKILSESPHVYFVGEGAEKFAAEHGIALCRNEELIIPREVERLREYQASLAASKPDGNDLFAPADDVTISHDTVGAVALDRNGNIAAATSTGGTLNKAPGRLGDSSLIGCGCYADNESAAASTTGWGEPIMKLVLAKWTADRIAAGNLPEWSAQEAMNYLKQRVNGHGGIIVLNREGHIGISHNTPRMAWAYKTVKKQESGIERETTS